MQDFWRCVDQLQRAHRIDAISINREATIGVNNLPVTEKILVKVRGGKAACWSIRDSLTAAISAGDLTICGHSRKLRAVVETHPKKKPVIQAGAKAMNTLSKEFDVASSDMHKPTWGMTYFEWRAVKSKVGAELSPPKKVIRWCATVGGYTILEEGLQYVAPEATVVDVQVALER